MEICEKELRRQRRFSSIIICIAFSLKLTHFPYVDKDVMKYIGENLTQPKQENNFILHRIHMILWCIRCGINNPTIAANCKPVHPKFREMFIVIMSFGKNKTYFNTKTWGGFHKAQWLDIICWATHKDSGILSVNTMSQTKDQKKVAECAQHLKKCYFQHNSGS